MPSDLNPLAYNGRVIGTEKVSGLCQFATAAQVTAGTRSDRAISPKQLDTRLSSEGFLQWADVTLTSAQIKSVRATPIELVAAQGAGAVIQLIAAQLKLNYGGTNAFTESADNLVIRYTDGSGAIVSGTIETTGFINQTADTYTNATPSADAIVAATGAENEALVIHNTGDGEIAGNAANDNTLTVRVYYVVHSL